LLNHRDRTLAAVFRFAGLDPLNEPSSKPSTDVSSSISGKASAVAVARGGSGGAAPAGALAAVVVNAAGPLDEMMTGLPGEGGLGEGLGEGTYGASSGDAYGSSPNDSSGPSADGGGGAALAYGALRCASSAVDPELIARVRSLLNLLLAWQYCIMRAFLHADSRNSWISIVLVFTPLQCFPQCHWQVFANANSDFYRLVGRDLGWARAAVPDVMVAAQTALTRRATAGRGGGQAAVHMKPAGLAAAPTVVSVNATPVAPGMFLGSGLEASVAVSLGQVSRVDDATSTSAAGEGITQSPLVAADGAAAASAAAAADDRGDRGGDGSGVCGGDGDGLGDLPGEAWDGNDTGPRFALEGYARLSESHLYKLMEAYFSAKGQEVSKAGQTLQIGQPWLVFPGSKLFTSALPGALSLLPCRGSCSVHILSFFHRISSSDAGQAWTSGEVPFWVTTCPLMGLTYAKMVALSTKPACHPFSHTSFVSLVTLFRWVMFSWSLPLLLLRCSWFI